jgi:hypothetical protein
LAASTEAERVDSLLAQLLEQFGLVDGYGRHFHRSYWRNRRREKTLIENIIQA